MGQLDMLKSKYEEAVEARRMTEQDIEILRPVRNTRLCLIFVYSADSLLSIFLSLLQDVDKATSARIALEKHQEQLEIELAFLQRVQKEVKYVCLSVQHVCV